MKTTLMLVAVGMFLGCGEIKQAPEGTSCTQAAVTVVCPAGSPGGIANGAPVDVGKARVCYTSDGDQITGCALPGGAVCVPGCLR